MKFKSASLNQQAVTFSTDRTLDQVQFPIPTHHSHHPTRSLIHRSPLSRQFQALSSLNLPQRILCHSMAYALLLVE